MACISPAAASTPQFVTDYMERASSLPVNVSRFISADTLTANERLAMMMLYAYMPQSDATDRTPQFYLDNAVRPAIAARSAMPWTISDEMFYHYVLPLRVNNEALDNHRIHFQAELLPRISRCTNMQEAALEINHWCHEKASYQPSDGRTHSPMQTLSSAIGRCGEESTFGVAAMRSVGIPARQVYTPRWAHTDDNHAWVEVWADGRWWFLGACEPEPVLNLGWFNEPASRGMLMHARTFGRWTGNGEVLAMQNGNTDINVTANYAPVDTVVVIVNDPDGKPISGAEVSLRIYNYAEFYPIATKYTDASGRASLITGRGDLLAWIRVPATGDMAFATIRASERTRTVVVPSAMPDVCNLDVTPPPASASATPAISPDMRARNNCLTAREDSIRTAYIASWPDTSTIRSLAANLGIDYSRLLPIIGNSRGNFRTITDFLLARKPAELPTALLLLESVAEKDLTDICPGVLSDVMEHLPERPEGLSDSDYGQYLLSPRVSLEELTPYRKYFLTQIPEALSDIYRANPQLWADWVKANIVDTLTWYPSQVTMSPAKVYEHRTSSALSRDILFVSAARTWGIPSRLNPITGFPQYLTDGIWTDVDFHNSDNESASTASAGCLQLLYTPSGKDDIADPRYYTHFTISAIRNGEPQLLSYPDFCCVSEVFATPQPLSPGRYMLTSGRRLADGSVLSQLKTFMIAPDSTTYVNLEIRRDTTQVQVIGTLDAELLYQAAGAADPQSLLSTAGRGYYVLGLMDADTEPSHHAINDLVQAAAELDSIGRTIFLLYPEGVTPSLPTALPRCTVIGTDIGNSISGALLQGLYIDNTSAAKGRPIFIVADSFGRVVYISSGYIIGLGTRLAELLHRL